MSAVVAYYQYTARIQNKVILQQYSLIAKRPLFVLCKRFLFLGALCFVFSPLLAYSLPCLAQAALIVCTSDNCYLFKLWSEDTHVIELHTWECSSQVQQQRGFDWPHACPVTEQQGLCAEKSPGTRVTAYNNCPNKIRPNEIHTDNSLSLLEGPCPERQGHSHPGTTLTGLLVAGHKLRQSWR